MARSAWWLPWAVYGPLAALGAGLAWLLHGQVLRAPHGPRLSDDLRLAQLTRLALAALVALLSTRWLVTHTAWAQKLHGTLRAALYGATRQRLLMLALASSVAEELCFRAALLPWIGVVASSLVFGLLHVSSRETYLAWMLWASLMGAVGGQLREHALPVHLRPYGYRHTPQVLTWTTAAPTVSTEATPFLRRA